MRKYWILLLILGVMLVSWCQITTENERKTQTGDGDSIQQESLSGKSTQTGEEAKLSPAQILSWKEAKLTLAEVQAQTGDDTPIVVITEANSGAIVTQTGDSLIYRNEVYGFQVKLGEETKGCKLFVDINSDNMPDNTTFLLYGKVWTGEESPLAWALWKLWAVEIGGARILSTDKYWDLYNEWGDSMRWFDSFIKDTLWYNQKYFFLQTFTNVGHKVLSDWLPNLKCTPYKHEDWYEGKDCWDVDRILFKDFTILKF